MHDIVVIGASAGGVEPLRALVRSLSPDLRAAVFVVLHLPPRKPSLLPWLLSQVTAIPTQDAEQGEPIEYGRIYVAPPDLHLVLERDHVVLNRDPQENRHRPSIDKLFRSAAFAFGPRVVGVILSGTLDDGVAGLRYIKSHGGLAVVQNPEEALCPEMPRNALQYVSVDRCLDVAAMAELINELAPAPVEREPAIAGSHGGHAAPGKELPPTGESAVQNNEDLPGELSLFTCPECEGPLFEIRDGDLTRYRCRIGHRLSLQSLDEGQREELTRLLWVCLEALEERISLKKRLAEHARDNNHAMLATDYREQVRANEQHAQDVRRILDTIT